MSLITDHLTPAERITPKGIVILSGGMDSTVLAYHVARRRQLDACVSVNYGQRHSKELLCAARTAEHLCVPHILLDLSAMREHLSNSALTGALDVPHGHYAEESMKATVVPNRNMILLALATGVAINRGAAFVAYGAHSGDHAIYPDCRPEFADAMARAIELCDYKHPALMRPFIGMTKADIVRAGVEMGVPFINTWTCYEGGEMACGKCGTCVERLAAFNEAGEIDPLAYADETSWRSIVSTYEQQAKLALNG